MFFKIFIKSSLKVFFYFLERWLNPKSYAFSKKIYIFTFFFLERSWEPRCSTHLEICFNRFFFLASFFLSSNKHRSRTILGHLIRRQFVDFFRRKSLKGCLDEWYLFHKSCGHRERGKYLIYSEKSLGRIAQFLS